MSTSVVKAQSLPVPPAASDSPGATSSANAGAVLGSKRPASPSAGAAPGKAARPSSQCGLAAGRVARELAQIRRENVEAQVGMKFRLPDEANVMEWEVVWLYELDALDASENHLTIQKQLREKGLEGIRLGMTFSEDYPGEAPFVYLKGPHVYCPIVFGGGGFCAETLSSEYGWTSASRAYQLQLTLRALVESYLDVRLDFSIKRDHTPESAKKNQDSIFEIHRKGWGSRVAKS